ncbi:hypothetical protein LSHI6S_04229 [Leifsonia shinshuensis]
MRVLTRVGLASIGLLHILIGVIALAVAFGAGGTADQSGALQAVAAVPGGVFVLWLIVIGLIVLAVWQLLVAVTAHGVGTKVVEVAKAVVYGALAVVTISVALGGGHNSTGKQRSSSAHLLAFPGGVFVLGLIGLMVVAVGVEFFRNGVTSRFERDLKLPRTAGRRRSPSSAASATSPRASPWCWSAAWSSWARSPTTPRRRPASTAASRRWPACRSASSRWS